MLVLSRGCSEDILIGDEIEVKVVSVGRDKVRLGIKAPAGVSIDRREVREQKKKEARNRTELCNA